MPTKLLLRSILTLLGFGLLAACAVDPQPPGEPDFSSTWVAQTVIAQITEQSKQTPLPGQPTPTHTPDPSTPTDLPPTQTVTASPTLTATPAPTETPSPPPTETPVPLPCDWVEFVDDITIEDGMGFTPGTRFTKTWRLKNIGRCTWASNYDLVFLRGDRLGGKRAVPLPERVSPGETIDVSVNLEAPDTPGDYQGFWGLRNPNGVVFGIGRSTNDPFWVEIDVVQPNRAYAYDFAINYCAAAWESGAGDLPCPGNNGDENGFAILLGMPELEHRKEDEPALWVRPNQRTNGWITATFPAFKLVSGDSFRAWVGCLADSPGCDVTFYLNYRVTGGLIRNLDTWEEKFDGEAVAIFYDLSDLSGESVSFILSVEVNNDEPENANAFWLAPRIENVRDIE